MLDAAPEFVQQHAQHAVADVSHVAGEQFVGQAHARSDGLQLLPHEVHVGVAGVGRVGEFDLLALHQLLQRAGLHGRHRRAIAVLHHRLAGDWVQHWRTFAAGLRDEAGEEVADLLPEQHGVVVAVERFQPQQHRCETWNAPQLTAFQGLEDVQHLVGGDAVQLVVGRSSCAVVTGMALVHPVRHPLAALIELDVSPHGVAAARGEVPVERHELRREHL
ncbi:hypothetical protein D9M69_386280 [compost metagenome]